MIPATPTGRVETLDLTGYLFIYSPGERMAFLLLRLEGATSGILPIFSSEAKLTEAVAWMKPKGPKGPWRIRLIDDPAEFLDSIPDGIVVGADPYLTPEGNTRWLQVQPGS